MHNLRNIKLILSLVADFGGTLGLFLGFSFIGLWDELHIIIGKLVEFLREKIKQQILKRKGTTGAQMKNIA